MLTIGLFIGCFVGLIVAWVGCLINESKADDRTFYMVMCLCVIFVFLVIATLGHYEGWFEIAEKVVDL